MRRLLLLFCLLGVVLPVTAGPPVKIAIGSKAFPESWILGDALAELARETGADVTHKSNLGATTIVYQALRQGTIDVYPEYTGTISEEFYKNRPHVTTGDMLDALAQDKIGMSYPLGFNDSYGIAVRREVYEKGVRSLTDLSAHPELILGLTPEFVGRGDGWGPLARTYALPSTNLKRMQHELAYQALSAGKVDAVDVYTTDAQIKRLDLVVLEDDKKFFPRYDAVLLYRADLPKRAPQAWGAMLRLVGQVTEERMIAANERVVLEDMSSVDSARILVSECVTGKAASLSGEVRGVNWSNMLRNTLRHLQLVAVSLAVAILIGIPLGVLASRSPLLANLTLTGTGLLQTIPSLALLAFLVSVPFLGVGIRSALCALLLYSLLPIVRNTYTGLTTIPGNLAEAAEAIGLTPAAQLVQVRLPMASPSILAGIKTSAVINVGTATLAALVGAGGLGDPILTGLTLNDTALILQGAVPAAMLALLVQGGFDLLERFVVPRGLRL